MKEDDIPMAQSGSVSNPPSTPKSEQVKTGSRVKPLVGSPPPAPKLPPVIYAFPRQPPQRKGGPLSRVDPNAPLSIREEARRYAGLGGTKRKKITKRKKHTKKQNGRRRK